MHKDKIRNLILELTKILNIDNFRLVASSYLSMGANAIIFFFLTPYLLDHLGKDQYGIWILLTNLITYFTLSNFGLNTAFMMEMPKVVDDTKKRNELINTVFFTLSGMIILLTAAYIAVDANLDYFFKMPSSMAGVASKAFLFIFLAFVVNIFYGFFDSVLYINNHIVLRNFIELGKILVMNACFLILIYFSFGIVEMGIFQLIVSIIVLVATIIYVKKLFPFRIDTSLYSRALFKSLLSPSFHFFFITIASQVVFYSDTILVSALAGIGFVGFYSITYKLTDVVLKVFFKLSDIKLPRIAFLWKEKKFVELRNFHGKLQLITLVGIAPFFLLFFLGGDWLIELWIGKSYNLDKQVIQVLCISMVLNAIVHVTALFIFAMGIHHSVSYMSLCEAALNIGLSVFFFKLWGLVGIPLGTVVATLSTTAWYIVYLFYKSVNREINSTAIS